MQVDRRVLLLRRADPKAWTDDLRRRAEAAIASRRVGLAVGAIGFLAVFREGAETVLFLAAVLRDAASPVALMPWLALAAVVLAGVWVAITRMAVRLPLRPLFLASSMFLLVMAARLAAAAVQEFPAHALIPFEPLDLPARAEVEGLPGNFEQVVAMAVVALLAVPALLAGLRPRGLMAAA